MSCCGSDSVLLSKMAVEVKSGPMLWYKKRFFRSNWRNVHCVLFNDSSLLWYKDKTRQEKDGALMLKEAPELIAFVPYTSQVTVPHTIQVLNKHSDSYVHKKLMAVGVKGKNILHCFLCPDEEEVPNWMAAIITTIPSPPPTLQPSPHLAKNPTQQKYHLLFSDISGQYPQTLSNAPQQKATTEEDKEEHGGGIRSFGVGVLLGGALGAAMGGDLALPRGPEEILDDNRRALDYYPDDTEDLCSNEAGQKLLQDEDPVENAAFARHRMMEYQMRQGTFEYDSHQEYLPMGEVVYTSVEHEVKDMCGWNEDGGVDGDFGGDGDYGGGNGDYGGDYMACFAVF